MNSGSEPNVYQAPETEGALPLEHSARPMRGLVITLDVCLGAYAVGEFALLVTFYAFGGSIWTQPIWIWKLAELIDYTYYVGCFLFLVFVYRAHRNARALGVRRLKTSSQRAVGWFLVPVVNVYRGYAVIRDLWKFSDQPHEVPRLLLYWWLASLTYTVLIWFAPEAFGQAYPDALRSLVVALGTVTVFLTSRVVHGIEARQAARALRV